MFFRIECQVNKIVDLGYENVKLFKSSSDNVLINSDYHCGLFNIKEGQIIQITFTDSMPSETGKNIYITCGQVYEIDRNGFKVSSGGLILEFCGNVFEGISLDLEIYISMIVI